MKGIIRRTASKLTRIVLFFDYERKELFCVCLLYTSDAADD